jgi:hypothetical protein
MLAAERETSREGCTGEDQPLNSEKQEESTNISPKRLEQSSSLPSKDKKDESMDGGIGINL